MNAISARAAASLASLPSNLIWRGGTFVRSGRKGHTTGFPALDAALPDGGWPQGAIIELLHEQPGIGEIHLLLPLLRTPPGDRWVAWVAPPCMPYAPALAGLAAGLSRQLLIDPPEPPAILWSARQALASGACHAVLMWSPHIDLSALRRLQLAAEKSTTPLFLFRSPSAAHQPSPAPLRLHLGARRDGLDIRILKRRGPALANPIRIRLDRPFDAFPSHALDSPAPPCIAAASPYARNG